MPKYRIVKWVRKSSCPSALWIDKPTDSDAVVATMALLRPGESADVWGERHFIGRADGPARHLLPRRLAVGGVVAGRLAAPAARLRTVMRTAPARLLHSRRSTAAHSAIPQAPGRTGLRHAMTTYVLAGLTMTAGIALVFTALFDGRHDQAADAAAARAPATAALSISVAADAAESAPLAPMVEAAAEPPRLPADPAPGVAEAPAEEPPAALAAPASDASAKLHRVRLARVRSTGHSHAHERVFAAGVGRGTNFYALAGDDRFARGGN